MRPDYSFFLYRPILLTETGLDLFIGYERSVLRVFLFSFSTSNDITPATETLKGDVYSRIISVGSGASRFKASCCLTS